MGAEFDRTDRAEVQTKVKDAEEAAKDEVWAGYRFVALADTKAANGLKIINLGAGHASSNETLCGRIYKANIGHCWVPSLKRWKATRNRPNLPWEWFLNDEEYRRLGRVLDEAERLRR